MRAVVFDAGNTLWFQARTPEPEEIYAIEADLARPVFRRLGIEPPIRLEDVVRDVWRAADEAYELAQERRTLEEPPLALLWRSGLAQYGVEVTAEQAEAIWLGAWLPVADFGVQLYPDALDTFRELKTMGVLIGANSNRGCTGELFKRDLDGFGLGTYVDAVVTSGDTGYMKPHPSTFELILERLGVVPADALMVGDSCAADMAGAKAAGMRTALKLNGRYGAPACPHADFAVHELSELLALPVFGRQRPAVVVTESLTPHEDGNEERY